MKKELVIVGGGSSALFLAGEINCSLYNISIYEKNATLGRKFLVAGDGGLNLSHSEAAENFIARYSPAGFLKTHFQAFSNQSFQNRLHQLGVETYVGSSGRIFPKKGIKPAEVLKALTLQLKKNHVKVHYKQEWLGFSESGALKFKHQSLVNEIKADVIVFCLGGASWPVTGSSGEWISYFLEKKIQIQAFEASNCAYKIDWPSGLIPNIAGKALKNCVFSSGSLKQSGEAVLTAFGIEGSGIYPLSPELRKQLHQYNGAELYIDFKPSLTESDLLLKLNKKAGKISYTEQLSKQLNLTKTQVALLKSTVSKENYLDPKTLVKAIKCLALKVSGAGPIEEAISTTGGIELNEITRHFELKKMPGHYAIGEMLDFDAPTGGYLLQACFTMAASLAKHLNDKRHETPMA